MTDPRRKVTLDEAREWVAEEGVSMSQSIGTWPSDELVEKVARALKGPKLHKHAIDFDGLVEVAKNYWRDKARAALSVLAPDLREVERLAAENKRLRDYIDKRGEHTDRVIQRLTRERDDYAKTIQSYREDTTKLVEDAMRLTEERDRAKETARDTVQLFYREIDAKVEAEDERDRTSALLRGMARRASELRKDFKRYVRDSESSENFWLRDRDNRRAQAEQLIAERDTARAELAAAQAENQHFREINESLARSAQGKSDAVVRLLSEAEARRAELAALHTQLAKAEEDKRMLRGGLHVSAQDVMSLTEARAGLLPDDARTRLIEATRKGRRDASDAFVASNGQATIDVDEFVGDALLREVRSWFQPESRCDKVEYEAGPEVRQHHPAPDPTTRSRREEG